MTPGYDAKTDEITGAPPKGSIAYYHELRHRQQNKEHDWQFMGLKGRVRSILDVADYLYWFAIPASIYLYFAYPVLAIWPIGLHYAFMVAIEADAWLYAFMHQESNYSGSV